MKKYAFTILILLTLLVLLGGCSMMQGGMPGLSQETTPTEEVVGEIVEPVDSEVSVEGRLVPPATILLSFSGTGQIEEIS